MVKLLHMAVSINQAIISECCQSILQTWNAISDQSYSIWQGSVRSEKLQLYTQTLSQWDDTSESFCIT